MLSDPQTLHLQNVTLLLSEPQIPHIMQFPFIYYFLWLCSPARAMASCGSAAQRGLWPPVALQPSAGYGLLWLCSPARTMASCGSAAQRGLWPPVALQPSAAYGLLRLCSPARTMASSFTRFRDHKQRSAKVVGLLWTSDQLVADTST
jgi:hypothetical protein